MFLPLIIHDYFLWHYGRAWWEMWGVWRNFIWYVVHLFSVPQLLRSLFAPYKRITERKRRGMQAEDLAAYVIINLLSRVLGCLIRLVIITVGLLALLVVLAIGFIVYTLWMVLPFLIIALLGASVSLFFISF